MTDFSLSTARHDVVCLPISKYTIFEMLVKYMVQVTRVKCKVALDDVKVGDAKRRTFHHRQAPKHHHAERAHSAALATE